MRHIIAILTTLAAAASLPLAQEAAPKDKQAPAGGEKRQRPKSEEIFRKMDANSNGTLSLEEFKAGRMDPRDPAKAEEIFKKMDTNTDKKVTLEEFKAGQTLRPPGGFKVETLR